MFLKISIELTLAKKCTKSRKRTMGIVWYLREVRIIYVCGAHVSQVVVMCAKSSG